MNVEAEFIKYTENELPAAQSYGLMGIATVSLFGEAQICNYLVKEGKDGKGFFIWPLTQKMNGESYKSHTLDSNSADMEVKEMIRKQVNQYYNQKTSSKEIYEPKGLPPLPGVTAMHVDEEVPF